LQEGFLLCRDVPIARIGEQIYHAGELPFLGMDDGMIRVVREPDKVLDPAFIAKPIVGGHPSEMVDPDNISEDQISSVTSVRPRRRHAARRSLVHHDVRPKAARKSST
jgi:hypothetical protein